MVVIRGANRRKYAWLAVLTCLALLMNTSVFEQESQKPSTLDKLKTKIVAPSGTDANYNNITISPVTPEGDYPLKVELDGRFDYSRCQAHGEDVRFYDEGNNSLVYWIEKWNNNGASIIWVKIPVTGTSGLTMRYGNASAVPLSNGKDVFPFFDGFDGDTLNSSLWNTERDSGSQTLRDGILIMEMTGTQDCVNSIFSKQSFGYNYTFRASARFDCTKSLVYANMGFGASTRGFVATTPEGGVLFADLYSDSNYYLSCHATAPGQAGISNTKPFPETGARYKTWQITKTSQSHVDYYINDELIHEYTGGITYTNPTSALFELHGQHISGHFNKKTLYIDWVLVDECRPVTCNANIVYPYASSDVQRRDIVISPATPEDEYTVRLNLDSNFNYDACFPNGADVRFYDASNASLPYWFESWNDAGESTIWIMVRETGTTRIEMEYGNKSLAPASNGNDAFLFFDDFSAVYLDQSKWSVYQDGYSNMYIQDDACYLYSATPSPWTCSAFHGFLTHQISGGTTIINNSVEFVNDNVRTYINSTATTSAGYHYNYTWTTFGISWINQSLVRFFGNETQVGEVTTNIPTVALPVRFFARDVYYASWTHYGAFISSSNISLGQPGRALRTRCYVEHDNTASTSALPACFNIDFVIVKKCAVLEPVASMVNDAPPTLTPSVVSPGSGTPSTMFNFSASYSDPEDDRPSFIEVCINGSPHTMTKVDHLAIDHRNPITYQFITYLQPGSYNYSFQAADGNSTVQTTTFMGPLVATSNTQAPALSNGHVSPPYGYKNKTFFTFSVDYTDTDNNAPSYVNVIIDSITYTMHQQDPADSNYMDSTSYSSTLKVNSTGIHTYSFQASDGSNVASTASFQGPNVVDPDENFESYTLGEQLINHSNWHNIGMPGFTPVAASKGGSMQGRMYDTSSSSQMNVYVDLPAGSGLEYWSIEMKLTWMKGQFYMYFSCGTDVFRFGIGSWGDTYRAAITYGDAGFVPFDPPAYLYSNVTSVLRLVKTSRGPDMYDVYLDDVKIVGFAVGVGTQTNNMTRISFFTQGAYNNEEMFIDDIDCSWTPNLSAPRLLDGHVTPPTGNQSQYYVFEAIYQDFDGNAPSFINVTLNTTQYRMTRLIPRDHAYVTGVRFVYGTHLQPGTYNYRFSCSDLVFSNTTAVMSLIVSASNLHAPVLSLPGVTPLEGASIVRNFTFTVRYTDVDNNPPAAINVTITGLNGSITVPMSRLDPADGVYSDGCTYYANVTLNLGYGTYNHTFRCSDGFPAEVGPIVGPHLDRAPTTLVTGNLKLYFAYEGRTFDMSYSGNTGGVYGITYQTSIMGEGAVFNGVGYIYSNLYNTLLSQTICTFFKANSFLPENTSLASPLLDCSSTGVSGYGLGVSNSSIIINTRNARVLHPYTFLPGVWYHVAAVIDRTGGKVTSYVNGTKIGESQVVFSTENSFRPYYVGRSWSGQLFTGMLDESRVYQRALTQGEIVALFNLPNNYVGPHLNQGKVEPLTGDQGTRFNLSVMYTDVDGNPPATIYANINGTNYMMERQNPLDEVYSDGCVYQRLIYLQPGSYNYYFNCSDGLFSNATVTYTGLTVTLLNSFDPEIVGFSVTPALGSHQTTFVFSAVYIDADNNFPASMTITINSSTYPMTRVDPADDNAMDGLLYRYQSTLTPGHYHFRFNCSDGARLNATGWNAGPTVNPFLFIQGSSISLLTPANNASIFNGFINFSWSSLGLSFGAINYTWQLSTDPTFSSFIDEIRGIIELPATSRVSALVNYSAGLYYWRIRPTYLDFTGNWTAASYFRLVINDHTPRLDDSAVVPTGGHQFIKYNFTVRYTDADNNAPTIMEVRLNSTGYAMQKMILDDVNYADGCWYKFESFLAPGDYNIVFFCSDGKRVNSTSPTVLLTVIFETGEPPQLDNPGVTPTLSDDTALYNFTVTYRDAGNDLPAAINVTINNTTYDMVKTVPGDVDATDGIVYYYSTFLATGFYRFMISAYDGKFTNVTQWIYNPVVNPFYMYVSNVTIFEDNFENGLSKWRQITGNWHLANESSAWSDPYHSATHAMWCGLEATGRYANSHEGSIISNAFSLVGYARAWLEFYNWQQTESSFDSTYVYISTNNGSSWTTLASRSGSINPWERRIFDLTSYCGNVNVVLRFRLSSDTSLVYRGWYVDDIKVFGYKTSPTFTLVSPASGSSRFNGPVTFSWNQAVYPFGLVDYSLQISNTSTFITIVQQTTAIPGVAGVNSATIEVDLPQGTYYWRVLPTVDPFFGKPSNAFTLTILRNDLAPLLESPNVDPPAGDQFSTFNYSVAYRDPEGYAPTYVVVSINGTNHTMAKVDPGATNYTSGIVYYFTSMLAPGYYNVTFMASDGKFPTASTVFLTVSSTNNNAPQMVEPLVIPKVTYNGSIDVYFHVTYLDLDNNTPAYVWLAMNGTTYPMVPGNPLDNNYIDGAWYHVTVSISVITCTNVHWFNCSDGTFTGTSGILTGPTVLDFNDLIVDGNLKLFYPFEGNAKDHSGNGYDASSSVTYRAGMVGQAAYFSGSTSVYSPYRNSASSFTICAFFNASQFITNAYLESPIVDSEYAGYTGTGFGVGASGINIRYRTGMIVRHPYNFTTNRWYYVTVTYDRINNLVVSYVNGEKVSESTVTFGTGTFWSQFGVGVDMYYNYRFRGLIDEVRVYTRVLSLDEILRLTWFMDNNHAPTLTGPTAAPMIVNQTDPVTFGVTYTDLDNNPAGQVLLYLNGSQYSMHKVNLADHDYTDGVLYETSLLLQPGSYTYFVSCTDGKFTNVTAVQPGPQVLSVNLGPPSLVNGRVLPQVGYNGTTWFTFTVEYFDPDNNAPASITVTINGTVRTLLKSNSSDFNYMDGCTYVLTIKIASIGTHWYQFNASDGIHLVADGVHSDMDVQYIFLHYFDGLEFSWAGYFDWLGQIRNGRERFADAGDGMFYVGSTGGISFFNRTVDGSTRVITDNSTGGYFNEGTHDWVKIPPAQSIGSTVGIAVIWSGEQLFTVTGLTTFTALGLQFICWRLQSPQGSIAYYDAYSGMLVNGTFTINLPGVGDTFYSIEVLSTNIPLRSNVHPPSLSNGSVSPVTGSELTLFNFSVCLADLDGGTPDYANVIINSTHHAMWKVDPSDLGFSDGCWYEYVSYLVPGHYQFEFEAFDGLHYVAIGTFVSLEVAGVNEAAPTLSALSVTPTTGHFNYTWFDFSVVYTDPDNNAPREINITIGTMTYPMVPLDPADSNYVDGRVYGFSTMLDVGSWTMQVACHDGQHTCTIGPDPGPSVDAVPHHWPIHIVGDAELDAFPDKSGSGTLVDPYVIEGFIINGYNTSSPVFIANTTRFLNLKDLTVICAPNDLDYAGIYLQGCEHVVLQGITARLNHIGIHAEGCRYLSITSCNVSESSYIGIEVESCHSLNVAGNTVWQNMLIGIDFMYCTNVSVTSNNVSESWSGIAMFYSDAFLVAWNNLTLNDAHGLYLDFCSYANITFNRFASNSVGLQIQEEESVHNVIAKNAFINNPSGQGHIGNFATDNDWDDGMNGNYWSDYTTRYPSATNNGFVWNTPYQVMGSAGTDYDYFPLVTFGVYQNLDVLPVANFTCDRSAIGPGQYVQFAFTGSLGNSPATFNWTFGDGGTSTEINPSHQYITPGMFDVTLTVRDADGDEDAISKVNFISVTNVLPVASFITNLTTTFKNSPISFTFTGYTGNDPATITWSFGDGTTPATGLTAVHAFTTDGAFQVMVNVTDADGDSDTDSCTITIIDLLPSISIVMNDTGLLTLDSIQFTVVGQFGDEPSTINWDFGDGTFGNGVTVVHTYTVPGSFLASVNVTDLDGDSAVVNATIMVADLLPLVMFEANATSIVIFEAVQFTFTGLAGDLPSLFTWHFGDGGTSTARNPIHQYTTDGWFSVNCSVTDWDGDTHEHVEVDFIYVGDLFPVAGFWENATAINETDYVQFLFTGSEGNGPATFLWDFGDGHTSTARDPIHQYNTSGTYTVSVEVHDKDGDVDAMVKPLLISVADELPVASFSSNLTVISLNQDVGFIFNGSLGNVPTGFAWDFGDGGTSTARDPTHKYTTHGNFTVTLIITDKDGDTDSLVMPWYIKVIDLLPRASFSTNGTVIGIGDYVQFTFNGTAGDAPTAYYWQFGDGTTDTAMEPVHQFTSFGDFSINLTVTDFDGDHDSVFMIDLIHVIDLTPTADFTVNYAVVGRWEVIQFTFIGALGDAPATFSWDFGDGNVSTVQNPTHAYASPGTFTVNLTVVDNDGDSDSVSMLGLITVIDLLPQANFTVSTGAVVAGGVVHFTFTGFVGDAPATFSWDFGDGNFSTSQDPDHAYGAWGSYAVTLNVTDSDGDMHSFTRAACVWVYDPVVPTIASCIVPSTIMVSEVHSISITFSDNLGAGYYSVELEGIFVVTNQTWMNGVPVFIPVNTTTAAVRNYTIHYHDQSWCAGTPMILEVTVNDAPQIIWKSADMEVPHSDTTLVISWTVTDSLPGHGNYTVRCDMRYMAVGIWTTGTPANTTVIPYFVPGRYEFVIEVQDALGARSTATIVITITGAGSGNELLDFIANNWLPLVAITGGVVAIAALGARARRVKKVKNLAKLKEFASPKAVGTPSKSLPGLDAWNLKLELPGDGSAGALTRREAIPETAIVPQQSEPRPMVDVVRYYCEPCGAYHDLPVAPEGSPSHTCPACNALLKRIAMCPRCGQALSIEQGAMAALGGTRIKCPGCENDVEVDPAPGNR